MSKKISRIGFATQQEDAGKSTSAPLPVSHLYFTQHHGVVVIDAGSPRHIIKKLRDRKSERFREDEDSKRASAQSGRGQVYPIAKLKMTPVFGRPAPDRPSTNKKACHPKISADTTIIHTPGSVTIEGISVVQKNVDRAIIPPQPEEMSPVSTAEFLGTLGGIASNENQTTKPIAFRSKVRLRSHEEVMSAHTEAFWTVEVRVLEPKFCTASK